MSEALRGACEQIAALRFRMADLERVLDAVRHERASEGRIATAEIERLRRGLAIIRADYPEARDVATAILWPMEKGGEA